jgi:triacylglycerol lipase
MLFLQVLFLFLFLKWSISTYSLDNTQLQIGVWLSGAAYCGKDNYKLMNIGGPAKGFIYKDTLYDLKTDIQGFIGVLPSTKFIYVVLRGSSSTINWLDDFEVKLISYLSYPECNCFVHNGFYKSMLGIKNKTIETVKILKKIYPLYSVMLTGHSYGASISQLLAMELEREGISTIIYNYGQPRVGDAKYASFVNTIIGVYWRATHNQDIVPHVPPIAGFGYLHSCREIFEDKNGKLNQCREELCEDPKCANQFSLIQTNSNDHLTYIGHRVSCNESIIN